MKYVLIGNAILLILTAFLGFWIQSLGVGADSLSQTLSRHGDYWPLYFPGFGLFFGALAYGVTRKSMEVDMYNDYVPKSAMRSAIAISFGPVLGFLLQAFVGLGAFGLASQQGMFSGVVILQILFFLAMGNYAPSLKAGGRLGLRTPWTLRDDQVWMKTHRMLGRGLMIVSLIAAPFLFFLEPFTVMKIHLAAIIAVKLSSIAYSFICWREISGQHA